MNENKHIHHDSQHPHLRHQHHQWNDQNRDELSAGRRDRAIRKEYGREIEEEELREGAMLDEQEAGLRSVKDNDVDKQWEKHWDEKARRKLRDPPEPRPRMQQGGSHE